MRFNPYPTSAVCETCKYSKPDDFHETTEGFHCKLNIKLDKVENPDDSDCKMYSEE
jgi:hypothetical protein